MIQGMVIVPEINDPFFGEIIKGISAFFMVIIGMRMLMKLQNNDTFARTCIKRIRKIYKKTNVRVCNLHF
ncbi:hypothetical protein EV214_12726 [Marinisporobacter balticus]|uniref:Uncharacterized protein n=1 Tax=Marinisporobacter balticus TaxID=2018667 RepID=A0A4R2K9S5_9FIRM|nr:hypothetical protein EV214_12726 [Marinisporobacter balticus]